jgi:putative flavoprotein involved in K+ transport
MLQRLDVPVFDHRGRIRHAGGVVESPGLYVIGTPVLRCSRSTFIDGAGNDARYLSAHLLSYLDDHPSGPPGIG